jgi:N-methylhydantoinase B
VTARNRDRTHFTPWGAGGGDAGKPSAFLLNPGGNREVNLGNTDVFTAEPGDRVRISSSGAGGWGPAYERDPARVLADAKRGFVSVEAAREDYGVVIKGGAVDEAATKRRRKAMEKGHDGRFFGFNVRRADHERLWNREAYRALVEILNELPVTWRFFVKHKVMEAMAALPKAQRKGTPGQVRQLAKRILADYPQTSEHRARAAAE